MRSLEVRLPNGSDGDSLVHVAARDAGWGLLFDAGDPRRLALRERLRLEHLFVSHCHVDHFIGFDALIRPRVCREDQIHVHGPERFLARVQARLDGYTWNLIEGKHFVVRAHEVGRHVVQHARFDSGDAFRRVDEGETPHDGGLAPRVFEDERLVVETAALDHHVVSQGWVVELRPSFRVRTERVDARGLAPGPWLAELKRRAADLAAGKAGSDARDLLALPDGTTEPVGALRDDLLERLRGDRVAYVTDTACTGETRPRIVRLAADADVFACGAPFLSSEVERARQTRHLTAAEAGALAAEAGARQLLLFHVSDRYAGDFRRHGDEAAAAAGGRVEVVASAEASPPE
jgi:ribonuclease Z